MAEAWERRWFGARTLITASGRNLRVLYPGKRSAGGGPDFQGALLEMDGVLIRGDVELHLRSSLWFQHGHQRDPAYRQVILHVVLEDDARLDSYLPGVETLCMGPLLRERLQHLDAPSEDPLVGICCHAKFTLDSVDPVVRGLARRRFERKASLFEADADAVGRNQALWEGSLAVLGYPRNRGAFKVLARAVPWSWIEAEIGCPERMESLVLGTAGWLSWACRAAQRAWPEVSAFWDVSPLPAKVWQTGGFRPAGSPWLRLLALVRLLAQQGGWNLLSRVKEVMRKEDCRVAWVVRVITGGPRPGLGAGCAVELLSNVLLPALAAEGVEEAWQVWCRLPSSGYGITRRMEERFGIDRPPRQVYWTQGLLELGARYCAEARQDVCPFQGIR
jgi:hypothetical protein